MKKKPKSLSPLMSDLGPHPIRRDELEERLSHMTQYALELELLYWRLVKHRGDCSFEEGTSDGCDCSVGGTSHLERDLYLLHGANPCPRCRVPMEDASFCDDCGYSNY